MPSFRKSKAFTLTELLVVMALMAVLFALSAAGFLGIRSGQSLKQASSQVLDQLSLARQSALSKNARVRWVVYSTNDERNGDPAAFRRMQLEIFDPTARQWKKHARAALLPVSIVFDPARSPLLTNATTTAGTSNSITFLASGRTELDPNNKRNHALTLADLRSSNNFITIQLDPISGRSRTFQP